MCCRWADPGFSEYVSQLQKQANEELTMESSNDELQQKAREVVAQIAALEKEFWAMAYTASSGSS